MLDTTCFKHYETLKYFIFTFLRTLFEVGKVAGSATYNQSKTVWSCVVLLCLFVYSVYSVMKAKRVCLFSLIRQKFFPKTLRCTHQSESSRTFLLHLCKKLLRVLLYCETSERQFWSNVHLLSISKASTWFALTQWTKVACQELFLSIFCALEPLNQLYHGAECILAPSLLPALSLSRERGHIVWDGDIKNTEPEQESGARYAVTVCTCVRQEGGVGGGRAGLARREEESRGRMGWAGGEEGEERGSNMGVRVLAVCRPRLWHYRTSAPLQKNQI